MTPNEDVGPFCAKYGDIAAIYYDYVNPISYCFGALFMIPIIYIFTTSYLRSVLKIKPISFCISISYFTLQLLTFIVLLIWSRFECHSAAISTIVHPIGVAMYSLQTLALVALLFDRLYKTYRGTDLQISKCTIICFIIVYLLTSVAFMSGVVLYVNAPTGIGAALGGMASICTQLLIASLFVIYIYKLYLVDKSSTLDTDKFIAVITKTSLLALLTMSVTFCCVISFSLMSVVNSAHYNYFVDVWVIADIYTNAIAVFLSYSCFNDIYLRMCGCCDKKCSERCMRKKERELSRVVSVTVESSKTRTVETTSETTQA